MFPKPSSDTDVCLSLRTLSSVFTIGEITRVTGKGLRGRGPLAGNEVENEGVRSGKQRGKRTFHCIDP